MDSVYELTDGGVFATEYARGPWDPNAQHGGAPAALLMRAFEQTEPDPGLALARVTYELVRPVPLGELRVSAAVTRPGRRVQLLEGAIETPDGTAVVKARAVRVRRAPVSAGSSVQPPPAPDTVAPASFGNGDSTLYPGDAIEMRFVAGEFFKPGPATCWFRLKVPVVAGEDPSPLQRLAAASDFPNGIATELDWTSYVFINPDLTLYVEREPVGEWVALEAAMRVSEDGTGVSEAVIYDRDGRVGRSLQSLYIAAR